MGHAHIGKMIKYLKKLMEAHPNRTHVYGALKNLESTTLYHCTGTKMGHTQPIKYEDGLFVGFTSVGTPPALVSSWFCIETQTPGCHSFSERSGSTHRRVMQAEVKWDGTPLHAHSFV